MNPVLLETLRTAQRFGFFGSRPIEEAAEHSMDFVRAVGELDRTARLVDLGSGGGLPGLVLADALAETTIVLLDRRQKRTDFLQRSVITLGMRHVEVRCADVKVLIDEVGSGVTPPFDVVTARGFGPPEFTLRSAARLIRPGGRIVISEPPAGDRWSAELLDELGLSATASGRVRVFALPSAPLV